MSAAIRGTWPGRIFGRASVVWGLHPCGPEHIEAVPVTFRAGRVAHVGAAGIIPPAAELIPPAADGKAARRRGSAVLTLPRKDVILREVRLPSTDPAQLAQMIRHEAPALLPWPIEDTVISHGIKPDPNHEAYSIAMLFMARRATLEQALRTARRAGFAVSRVEVSTLSLARLLRLTGNPDAGLAAGNADSFDYVRLAGGQPAFSRGVASTEEAALEKSIAFDQHKHGRSADLSVLYASTPEASASDSAVAPLSALPLSAVCGLTADDLASPVSLGAALLPMDDVAPINLLPPSELRRLGRRRLLMTSGKLLLGAAWLLTVAGSSAAVLFHAEQARLASSQREIARLKEEVGNLESKSEQLALLARERARITLPLRLVLELYERVPLRVAINSLRFDARGLLTLGGEAPSYADVLACLAALQESPLLDGLTLLYSSKPRAGDNALVEFKLQSLVKEAT